MSVETERIPRAKYGNIMRSDPIYPTTIPHQAEEEYHRRNSSASGVGEAVFDRMSCEGSPMMMSPWNQAMPFMQTQWSSVAEEKLPQNGLIGSLVREEGHIYSLAARKDLLYTGSDSKNIRVWKNLKEFSAFKCNSGLVKAIVILGEKIFTGHQDGKIRVWKISPKNTSLHKRSGTLPTLKDIFKASLKPRNYIEVKKNRTALWIKHADAVSCLSLNEEQGLLYSASWDRTIKVWRITDSKCLESIPAHDDAVNSVVSTTDSIVFSGSADGTVKAWKREQHGKCTKHTLVQTLTKQESAVTALAISKSGGAVYFGSSDGLVNFWDREKQLCYGGVLKGHKLAVLCLEAAGSLVFSGSADKTIYVWKRDGKIHTCLSILTGHTGPVKCLAVEADYGDEKWILYSGSLDKSVKVWGSSEAIMDMNQTGMMQQQQQVILDSEPFMSDGSFSSSAGGARH
ncbi:PREDICTED: uncharacterized protein LOC104803785 [Tarenaya hassleriana]|uniref:uncharacterized protein LOC104803785 n=1 Tax=Tarenaya hassleriana TaxID=28532 RepID=UPI00053C9198|nr:PREDICTED: uncharacterized protein LOC104803785 [Tarenaya hassleriana]